MEVIRGANNLSRPLNKPVVTIGNFDGIHIGHQDLIKKVLYAAKNRAGTSAIYTFRPHPQAILTSDVELELLLTYDEKLELMAELGVDVIIEEPFNKDFSFTEPERFFYDVLIKRVGAEEIIIGFDFAFGRKRHGTLPVLESMCRRAGIGFSALPPYRSGTEVVSSSAIRRYLKSGDIINANRLSGREFFYRGVVMHGDRRGHELGFPTANFRVEGKLELPYGVYATVTSCSGKNYPSVTNIGVRPTFCGPIKPLIETHLINTDIDLYGIGIEVKFLRYLRSERKFSDANDLKTQIAKDIDETLTKPPWTLKIK
ncbi:MAG: bifunctional riboflavin kinase/FAD synthetase [Bdellovibrionota bacterium]